MEITCRELQLPALKTALEVVASLEDLDSALYTRASELGLPGSVYTIVVQSQRLHPLRSSIDAFRLLLDNGTYGALWEVVIARCNTCPEPHAAIGDIVPSIEWASSPIDNVD